MDQVDLDSSKESNDTSIAAISDETTNDSNAENNSFADENSSAETDHADIFNDVKKCGAGNKGKLFIGGLSWKTTEEGLRAYFEKFGQVVDIALMKDRDSGQPRGFGFVQYQDIEVVDEILSQTHTIDGRPVDVKLAVPRGKIRPSAAKPRPEIKKVFVGGLHATVDDKTFRTYFEQYGKVVDAVVMIDRQTKRSRGFGFVSFGSEDPVKEILKTKHSLNGKAVEIKPAEPREATQAVPCLLPGGLSSLGAGLAGLHPYWSQLGLNLSLGLPPPPYPTQYHPQANTHYASALYAGLHGGGGVVVGGGGGNGTTSAGSSSGPPPALSPPHPQHLHQLTPLGMGGLGGMGGLSLPSMASGGLGPPSPHGLAPALAPPPAPASPLSIAGTTPPATPAASSSPSPSPTGATTVNYDQQTGAGLPYQYMYPGGGGGGGQFSPANAVSSHAPVALLEPFGRKKAAPGVGLGLGAPGEMHNSSSGGGGGDGDGKNGSGIAGSTNTSTKSLGQWYEGQGPLQYHHQQHQQHQQQLHGLQNWGLPSSSTSYNTAAISGLKLQQQQQQQQPQRPAGQKRGGK